MTIKRLESGYLRAQGSGPCEWAQWPEGQMPRDADFFPEASEEFRRQLLEFLDRPDPTPILRPGGSDV